MVEVALLMSNAAGLRLAWGILSNGISPTSTKLDFVEHKPSVYAGLRAVCGGLDTYKHRPKRRESGGLLP